MRRALAGCVAVVLALSACGSTDEEPVVAAAAGTADAESGIVDEGDSQPEGERDGASVIAVTVDVPSGAVLAGTAIVALEDVTIADVEAIEIGRVELPAADLEAQNNRVELFLPLPLDGSIDVTATVHIDVDENGTFSQGDWISPALAMVTVGTESVTVEIVQI